MSAGRSPQNAQHEPPYPGAETVTFSIRFPERTSHRATDRCRIEEPHAVDDCGEWCAETPETMRRELKAEPRLRMHRPGLLPGMGRDAEMDQRVFDVAMLRYEGLSYAEIGRRVGRCREVVRNYCRWYVTGPEFDAASTPPRPGESRP